MSDIEPRGDMLPDSPPVEVTPPADTHVAPAPERPVADPPAPAPALPPKPPAGFVPLKALQEERRLRQDLEDRLTVLEAGGGSSPVEFSDEGKAIMGEIKSLKNRIGDYERADQLRGVL